MIISRIYTILIFLISPLLSLPFILFNIYKKDKFGIIFFSILIGILGYLYLPSIEQDGAKRYLLYESFINYSFESFYFNYLTFRIDFIFYTLIFLFSYYGLKYQLLLFAFSFFNSFVPLFLMQKMLKGKEISNEVYFIFFLLIFSTFSYIYLFSGIRQLLGFSLVELGIYYIFFAKKNFFGYLFLVLGFLTHFSVIIFIPLVIIFKYFNKFLLIILVIIMVLFMNNFSPEVIKTVLKDQSTIDSETYDEKVDAYFEYETNASKKRTFNTAIAKFLKSLWFYVSFIYLFLTYNLKKTKIRSIHYLLLIPIIVFYPFPGIAGRFIYLAQVSFAFLLISDAIYMKNVSWVYVFFGLFIITPLYEITRHITDSIVAGILRADNITLFQIILQEYTSEDLLN